VTAYELAYLPWCKKWEGCCAWFYLDTRGNVTVWVGFLVETALIAKTLPMYLPGLTVAATVDEIARAWNTVDAMQEGHMPAFYAYPGCLQMQEKDGDALLLAKLDALDKGLAAGIPGFEALPEPWKMACLDQAFNLGLYGFLHGYPHEIACIVAGDGTGAATECHRNGISNARNAWCAAQFMGAVQTQVASLVNR
jgi:GH24 family phage-related lysozyme (muramidase)